MILVTYDSFEKHVSVLTKEDSNQQIREITLFLENLEPYRNQEKLLINDYQLADLQLWQFYSKYAIRLLWLLSKKLNYSTKNWKESIPYPVPHFVTHGIYGRLYKLSCRVQLLKHDTYYKKFWPKLAKADFNKFPSKPFSMHSINNKQKQINEQWIKLYENQLPELKLRYNINPEKWKHTLCKKALND